MLLLITKYVKYDADLIYIYYERKNNGVNIIKIKKKMLLKTYLLYFYH